MHDVPDPGAPAAGTATPSASASSSLSRRALSLGAANAFDYAMQFLLPVVLVRFLTPEAFGQYRLLWLVVMTVMVMIPLNMHQVLYYFLPRADTGGKRLHVHMTLLYLGCAGVLGGILVGPWNPLLPAGMAPLAAYGVLIPALVLLFAATVLLDMLPTIEERVHWQASVTVGLSLLRTFTLGWAAWATGDLRTLIGVLLVLMLLKLGLLLGYISRQHGLTGRWFERRAFAEQFRHAAPFGVSTALYGLRGQSDLWVVAAIFAIGSFAAFSIAAVLGPMVNLFRQSVNHVFLPSMSRLQSVGDMAGMVRLNGRANVMVATLVYPLLTFAFVFAEEIVSFIYTDAYVAAAPVMRVYAAGLVAFTIELSGIMLLMRQGAFALWLNLALLALSVVVSWIAAGHVGLAGAALGSTLALYVDRYATLRRISSSTGLPLRQLQNWPALGRLIAYSALAGAAAWLYRSSPLQVKGALLHLLVGAVVLTLVYGALWARDDAVRRWFAPPLKTPLQP